MKQTRNEGCPRKNCQARVRKIVMRNPHWRERCEIVGYDEATGLPKVGPWHAEPVIVTRPVRRLRRRHRWYRTYSPNWAKHVLDALYRAPIQEPA